MMEVVAEIPSVLAVLWAAICGVLFLVSPSFRARKRKQWGKESSMSATSEWGEWLVVGLFVLLIVGAVAGMLARGIWA